MPSDQSRLIEQATFTYSLLQLKTKEENAKALLTCSLYLISFSNDLGSPVWRTVTCRDDFCLWWYLFNRVTEI